MYFRAKSLDVVLLFAARAICTIWAYHSNPQTTKPERSESSGLGPLNPKSLGFRVRV